MHAIIGGLHLFPATDQQRDWTADKLKQFKVANLVGAHCTGIEAVYRFREHCREHPPLGARLDQALFRGKGYIMANCRK